MMKKSRLLIAAGALLGLIGLAASRPPEFPGQRLARILSVRSNITVYVGLDGARWETVTSHTETGVETASRSWLFDEIRHFVAAYPSGELLDAEAVVDLPDDTHYMRDAPPVAFSIDQKQITQHATVSFSGSAIHPKDPSYYKTSIRNESSIPLKVLRFGGFIPSGRRTWKLNNASGGFYTSTQFAEWYGCADAVIAPGQTVSDPANYGGRPVLWAYEVESGSERFWVGGTW